MSVLDVLFPTKVNKYLMVNSIRGIDDCEVSMEELGSAVRRMKNNVAPGPGGIAAGVISRAFEDMK